MKEAFVFTIVTIQVIMLVSQIFAYKKDKAGLAISLGILQVPLMLALTAVSD